MAGTVNAFLVNGTDLIIGGGFGSSPSQPGSYLTVKINQNETIRYLIVLKNSDGKLLLRLGVHMYLEDPLQDLFWL